MHGLGDSRKDLRRNYPVLVRARCGRCGRVVADCYGEGGPAGVMLSACWSESGARSGLVRAIFPPWATNRIVHWRCRCGADYPISGIKLAVAFGSVATGATKRDRVIELPGDLVLPANFHA